MDVGVPDGPDGMISRFDVVLLGMPGIFLLTVVFGIVLSRSTATILAAASSLSTLPMAYGLFLSPPKRD
ncbi:MAG: hypothetical protein ABEJ58_03450 [Halodesulfurarchaeum sp.]